MRELVANAILECAQKGIFNPFEIAPRVSMSRSNPCLILRLTKAAGSGDETEALALYTLL